MKIDPRISGDSNGGKAQRGRWLHPGVHICRLFNLTGFPSERRDAALHIEAPALLFPFARKILTSLLQMNGFPYRIPPAFPFVGRYTDELNLTGQGNIQVA
jgi:preprotein translocase subunit SecB